MGRTLKQSLFSRLGVGSRQEDRRRQCIRPCEACLTSVNNTKFELASGNIVILFTGTLEYRGVKKFMVLIGLRV